MWHTLMNRATNEMESCIQQDAHTAHTTRTAIIKGIIILKIELYSGLFDMKPSRAEECESI